METYVITKNRVKPSKLPAVIQEYWGVSLGDEKYEYYSQFVHTVANSDLFHLEEFQKYKDDESLDVDMFKLVLEVVPELTTAVIKPNWPEDEPPWIPVMTEAGACFNTNSRTILEVATVPLNSNETKKYPLTCKYSSMTCAIMLEFFLTNFTFYIHSPYDVMDISNPPKLAVIVASSRETTLSVMETRSGKGVQELAPTRRACRYTFEPVSESKKVYSTNTCRLSCRAKLAVKLCGCKPFYYFYEDGPTCTPAGMACLSLHRSALANFGGQRCVCPQQCVASVFQETALVEHYWGPGLFGNRGSVRFIVQAPRTRYTKEIVFHFQDLVVSFGGAAGLFLGASFISFVEILYFILERVCTCCIGEDTKKEEDVNAKAKKQKMPYETARIMELNSILESQKKFEHGRHMKLYY